MRLGDKQRAFSLAVSYLIQKAYELGYEITLGDAYRDPRAFGHFDRPGVYGRKRSCHKLRLAIDLNLFKDGKYLTKTEDHRKLGEWWEREYPQYGASWGGHWNDGNHYSFEMWGAR